MFVLPGPVMTEGARFRHQECALVNVRQHPHRSWILGRGRESTCTSVSAGVGLSESQNQTHEWSCWWSTRPELQLSRCARRKWRQLCLPHEREVQVFRSRVPGRVTGHTGQDVCTHSSRKET